MPVLLPVQRYFTVNAPDIAQPLAPSFTASHRTKFTSQEFREGEAFRTTKRKRAGGSYQGTTYAHTPGPGFQRRGPRQNVAANQVALNVSEGGRMAIESTASQPRVFFADPGMVAASNTTLRNLASPIRLMTGGGTVTVPQNPDPLNHDPTPRVLDRVSADPLIPNDHPSTLAGQALIDAYTNSECNNAVKVVLGAAESARKAVIGTSAGLNETEIEGSEKSEPVNEIANFVAITNVGSGNVGALSTATQTRVPFAQEANVETAYHGMAGPPSPSLGINDQALPEVGEGYAIRSLAGITRDPNVTFSNPSLTDVDDEYLKAIQDLQAANGMVDAVLSNVALSQADANRAMALKTFWGEHYAGVVAKDGGDTVTYENYNRMPQWKWPINEAFNDLYANVAAFRAYIRGLNQVMTARNYGRQIQQINDFVNHLTATGQVLGVPQQQRLDTAVNAARGSIDNALAKDMMYFQMYGQQPGQSFHEKFTTSQGVMAATANAMTLRVRASLNDHRATSLNKANQSIGRIIHALVPNSTHPHLNAALQNMRNNFTPEAGTVLLALANATTVRKVEKAMMRLDRAKQALRVELVQEILHIDPASNVQPDLALAASTQTLVANYQIGKSPIGRKTRKREKAALRLIAAIAADVY